MLGCKNQPNCEEVTPVKVDLSDIDIEGEVKDNRIMLTDTIGVTLESSKLQRGTRYCRDR